MPRLDDGRRIRPNQDETMFVRFDRLYHLIANLDFRQMLPYFYTLGEAFGFMPD